jgi:hypothetical protein
MDATSIYAITTLQTYHRLIAIGKRDGSVTELGVKLPAPLRLSVLVDGDSIYYSSRLDNPWGGAPLLRVPRGGGAAVEIAPKGYYAVITRVADELFFYEGDDLRRMPRRGGESRLVEGNVEHFAVAGSWIYLAASPPGARGLIMRYALSSDAHEQLLQTDTACRAHGFFADANAVYWADPQAVYSAAAKSGWKATEIYRAPPGSSVSLEATNAKDLFLLLRAPKAKWDSLSRLSKQGGAPVPIAPQCVWAVADDSGVYYVEAGERFTLMRAP